MAMNWKTRGRLFGLGWLAVAFVNANAGYTLPGATDVESDAPTVQVSANPDGFAALFSARRAEHRDGGLPETTDAAQVVASLAIAPSPTHW